MQCPHCADKIRAPTPQWARQCPPYVCGGCGGLWGLRYHNCQPFAIASTITPLEPLMSWQQAAKWAQGNGLRPYVYAICYPNGLPFYVGKGNGHRLMAHAAFLRLTDLWTKVPQPTNEKELILWQLARNRDYERYAILAICDTDQEAFDIESIAIKLYGRRESGGLLANVTQAVAPPDRPLPPMPDPGELWTDGWFPWDLSSELNPRATTQYGGLVQWCPKCDNLSMCARTQTVADKRCPICFHAFELVDEAKLRKWIPAEALNDLKSVVAAVAEQAAPIIDQPTQDPTYLPDIRDPARPQFYVVLGMTLLVGVLLGAVLIASWMKA